MDQLKKLVKLTSPKSPGVGAAFGKLKLGELSVHEFLKQFVPPEPCKQSALLGDLLNKLGKDGMVTILPSDKGFEFEVTVATDEGLREGSVKGVIFEQALKEAIAFASNPPPKKKPRKPKPKKKSPENDDKENK